MKGFVIFTSLCLAQPVKAEPAYTPQIIPRCKVLKINSSEYRCTYTLDEVRALYEADSELIKLQNISMLQGQKLLLQSDIISWQQEQLKLSAKNTALFHGRMNSLTKLYVRTDKSLQAQLAKPKWGSIVAWSLVLAIATLFTGYVVADQVSK